MQPRKPSLNKENPKGTGVLGLVSSLFVSCHVVSGPIEGGEASRRRGGGEREGGRPMPA